MSRKSDKAFAFYSSFCNCAKRGRKIRRKKTKKLSQFLKSHISGTLEAISLKFGMWSTEVGWSVHSKNRIISSKQHGAMEVRKLRFLSSCQYTHGCYAPASWAARHTTVCLDVQAKKLLDVAIASYTSARAMKEWKERGVRHDLKILYEIPNPTKFQARFRIPRNI